MPSCGKGVVQSLLRLLGKRVDKVIVVFGAAPNRCHAAVLYIHQQVPDIPVWLFSATPPLPETRLLCERVHVEGNPLGLLLRAEVCLWRQWVALSVGTWTGERGGWPLKLAPLLIPPFRALFMNHLPRS